MNHRSLLPGITSPLIGMVHLKALPGAPLYGGSLVAVIDAAVADAVALDEGGIDAIMIENYGDVPFARGAVEPHTIAAMTAAVAEIARATRRPLGINVLRNDPIAALAIASTCNAALIRVNVHTGAVVADQGMIQGDARRTLEYRRALGIATLILADINVKHARPLVSFPAAEAAADAVERGLADGLIVTGARTGAPLEVDELRAVRDAVDVPVIAGSGVTAGSVAEILSYCDGAIVGSSLKFPGGVDRPVDRARVADLVAARR
jgi:membrane complex biogenesis BtpA family protein